MTARDSELIMSDGPGGQGVEASSPDPANRSAAAGPSA